MPLDANCNATCAPIPNNGANDPKIHSQYWITFIESRHPFLLFDFSKTVNNAAVFGLMIRLVDQSDFNDFERLHDYDLNPSAHAPADEIFGYIY